MKKINKKILLLSMLLLFITSGCTKYLKDSDDKAISNPVTGQNLTENILCKPTDEKTLEIYEKNDVSLEELPACEDFSVFSKYEGLWTSFFVKPLAFAIISIGKFVKSNGLALIITSLIIRFAVFPVTRKTAMQSELLKKAKPEIDRIEKKYKDKTDNDSMMRRAQELSMVYKKYDINPVSGCLFAFLQLPLFIAFFEAINRVPAIFEETFLGFQLGTTPVTGVTNGSWSYLLLLVLVGLSTYFSFKLNSTAANGGGVDQKQMNTMNNFMVGIIVFSALMMPAALNIYWVTTNLFTIGQNLLVKRKRV